MVWRVARYLTAVSYPLRSSERPPPLPRSANWSSDRHSFLARENWGNSKHITPEREAEPRKEKGAD